MWQKAAPVPAVAMLLGVILAGCLVDVPVQPTDASVWPGKPQCAFTYPDGSAVPCVNEAERVTALVGLPSPAGGWTCAAETEADGLHITYHRNHVTGEVAFGYSGENPQGFDEGMVWDGDRILLFPLVHEQNHVVFERGSTDSVMTDAFRLTHSVLGAVPDGAEALWSLYDGSPWLIYRLDHAEGSAWFQPVSLVTLGIGGQPFPAIHPMTYGESEGIEVTIDYADWGGFGVGSPPLLDGDCTV